MKAEITSYWAIVLQLNETRIQYRADGLVMKFVGDEFKGFAKAEDVQALLVALAVANSARTKGISKCPACNGDGVVENETKASGNGSLEIRPCRRCYGAGYRKDTDEGIVDIPQGRN